MKVLKLKDAGAQKLARGEWELFERDCVEFSKGLTPGEWIILEDEKSKLKHLAYVNPVAKNGLVIKLFELNIEKKIRSNLNVQDIWNTIESKLKLACDRRAVFLSYKSGSRLVYGANDGLVGLIVDQYVQHILIQINTAGLDAFREQIKNFFKTRFPEHQVYILDNDVYRANEGLPNYEDQLAQFDEIKVEENGLKYLVNRKSLQKIGYYYDHRENRLKLSRLITSMDLPYQSGLDLFSYVGSWGMHLLKSGIKHVTFVDQGDFEKIITQNLSLNEFELSCGQFVRSDVFKWLNDAIKNNLEFDVVVSDPPAFAKSDKNVDAALSGYEKLHTLALQLTKNNGLFVAASCTHYVDVLSLDKTVQRSLRKLSVGGQLLDMGIQGFDHPVSSLQDKGLYIKYLVYKITK